MAICWSLLTRDIVGDYSIFVKHWKQPEGGLQSYLKSFIGSSDATFQHISTWTLLQLLESGDKQLVQLITQSEDIVQLIKTISDRSIESDEEDGDEGKGEVVALARRCLELLGRNSQ